MYCDTCRFLREYVKKQCYWKRAISKGLKTIVSPWIDERRFALIDVFHGLPADGLVDNPIFYNRVAWLLPRSGLGTRWFRDASDNRYRTFTLLNRNAKPKFSCIAIVWKWHMNDFHDFCIRSQNEKLEWISFFPLHPTVRTSTYSRLGRTIWEIDDPKGDRTWIGEARYVYDAEKKVGTMIPEDFLEVGIWIKKEK